MDKYKIDSHKLIYHPITVSDWLKGKNIYPIYMEVSPSGDCNHRCSYCALDFMGYENNFLDTNTFKNVLTEISNLGVKSIMYAGEGEPLMHKDISEIVRHTKFSGIDCSITTNGVLFDVKLANAIVPNTEWIKFSINAGDSKTYSKIHRSNKDDFGTVLDNIRYAVRLRNYYNYKCIIGTQILLLHDNVDSVEKLVKTSRDLGVNYIVIKPYSHHPQSKTTKYKDITYNEYLDLNDKLSKYSTDKFNVVFRLNTMKKYDSKERNYKKCSALPFWSYIDSFGNVWGCSIYLKNNKFKYGNIYEKDFKSIWESDKRFHSLNYVKDMDISNCRINCRMDEVNKYLDNLINKPEHVNFI